jgi:hypothetical protein
MKTLEQRQARELRAQGWSVKEIEQELGVARSSVSRWVRHVELDAGQQQSLAERGRLAAHAAAQRKARAAREVRRGYQNVGRRLVRERDGSYAAGCMLYWAEGSKERNSLKIVNSDPELLVTFVRFLRTHFAVPNARIKISCNLFADHAVRQHETESFWLTRLGLDHASLRRSTVNAYSRASQRKRTNALPYGTCAVVVNDTRLVQTIYGSIQEYGGFDRPEWLD